MSDIITVNMDRMQSAHNGFAEKCNSEIKSYKQWERKTKKVFVKNHDRIGQFFPARLLTEYYATPGFYMYWYNSAFFHVNMPYNFEYIADIQSLLETFSWELLRSEDDTDYNDIPFLRMVFTNDNLPGIYVELQCNAQNENSNCKLVKVGTKKVDVMEIQCND